MSKCTILAFLQTLSMELSIPPGILPAIVMQESSFQSDALSHKNAKGLMQITPIAAREVAIQVKRKRLPKICDVTGSHFAPKVSMILGACYFKLMLEHFDRNVKWSLAAYNCGPDCARGKKLPKETRKYIKEIPERMKSQEITCKKP